MKAAMRFPAFLALAILLILPINGYGARRGRGGGGRRFPAVKKKVIKPQYNSISAVDVNAHTVTTRYVNTPSPAPRTLRISETTEIEVNGRKATIYDLKAGMKVTCGLGTDPSVASRLVATRAP